MAEHMNERSGTKERAANVAGTAQQQARGVAGDAREQASVVASEVSDQARNFAGEARRAVDDQARDQTHRLAGTIDGMGGKLQALAHGDADQAGELRDYVDDLGQRLHGVAERLDSKGLDGMVEDVQRFARRRPGVFLASAVAAGFVAGRLARGASGQGDGQGQETRGEPFAGSTAPDATVPRTAAPPYSGASVATDPQATRPNPPVPPVSGSPR